MTVTFLVMDGLTLKELPEVFDSAIDSGLFHIFLVVLAILYLFNQGDPAAAFEGDDGQVGLSVGNQGTSDP